MSAADTTCTEQEGVTFVGWMLWNIVRAQHVSRGAKWPDGIFEDLPSAEQTAWNRAAAELQQRAKWFGRLI